MHARPAAHAQGVVDPMTRAPGPVWPPTLGPPFQCTAMTVLYHADSAGQEQPWRSLATDRI
eukprot:979262-Lingulodinium_polyedra.AAC.1